jgi:hypothetical protein
MLAPADAASEVAGADVRPAAHATTRRRAAARLLPYAF